MGDRLFCSLTQDKFNAKKLSSNNLLCILNVPLDTQNHCTTFLKINFKSQSHDLTFLFVFSKSCHDFLIFVFKSQSQD